MGDQAITCRGLSKRYRRGERAPHRRLTEAITALPRRIANILSNGRNGAHPLRHSPSSAWFWALDHIDLDVNEGEVLGVIGHNGAGKSTLLKVLSRITEPTEGYARIRGRVGSLLEVGTGFHPELTGRENIYLNGAVIGMTRKEIQRRFDDIIAFADIEDFLDTPVKRFSSGMQTRLGFAVAAHLEPEILIVDEVLAVGDAAFQKKCLGKMSEVAKSGRTVLFVSHNMSAIRELCSRAVLIHQGRLISDGSPQDVVSHYLTKIAQAELRHPLDADVGFRVNQVVVKGVTSNTPGHIYPGEATRIELSIQCPQRIEHPYLWLTLSSGRHDVAFASMFLDNTRPGALEGNHRICCEFQSLPLLPGFYTIRLGARERDGQTSIIKTADVGYFEVEGTLSEIGLSGLGTSIAERAFPVVHPYRWIFDDDEQAWVHLHSPAPKGHRS